MQVDQTLKPTAETSPKTSYHAPPIYRPSSAMPMRSFAQPQIETAVGIASTIPYLPVSSQTAKKEFGYVQKRLRKTSMDVSAMVGNPLFIAHS